MKSLKNGWRPLKDIYIENNIDQGYSNRLLKKLSDDFKEQIGRTWVVKEDEFLIIAGKKIKNDFSSIDKFEDIFVEKIDYFDIELLFKSIDTIDNLIKNLLSICIKNSIEVPIGVVAKLKEDKTFKYTLVSQLFLKFKQL